MYLWLCNWPLVDMCSCSDFSNLKCESLFSCKMAPNVSAPLDSMTSSFTRRSRKLLSDVIRKAVLFVWIRRSSMNSDAILLFLSCFYHETFSTFFNFTLRCECVILLMNLGSVLLTVQLCRAFTMLRTQQLLFGKRAAWKNNTDVTLRCVLLQTNESSSYLSSSFMVAFLWSLFSSNVMISHSSKSILS